MLCCLLCCASRYDEANSDLELKDEHGKHLDVEEDAFQKFVDRKLQARPVDPDDKSFRAYLTRFRWENTMHMEPA